MAVREYVGARYVPIYVGDWDSTMQTTYEPLSIVTVPNVGSYTSKQFVPVGVPITDTDYWALSGSTSGQIINLDNRLTQAENDIVNLQNSDLSINDSITTISNAVYNNNRRVVTIADSYGLHPDAANSWTGRLPILVSGIAYQYDIQHNGIGYYRQSGGYNAYTLYQAEKSNITDIATITDVVICLGMNDCDETLNNVRTSAYNLFQQINTDMPNAKIWVGYPELGTHLNDDQLSNITMIIGAVEGIAARCNYCKWMAGLENIMHDTSFQEADGAHPNATGSNEIVRGIAAYMNGGSYKYYLSTSRQAHWGDGDVSACRVLIDGDITRIYLEAINKSATVALTASNWVTVATLDSCRIMNRSLASVVVNIRDLDSTDLIPAEVRTEGNEVKVLLLQGNHTIRFRMPNVTLIMPTLES